MRALQRTLSGWTTPDSVGICHDADSQKLRQAGLHQSGCNGATAAHLLTIAEAIAPPGKLALIDGDRDR